MRLLAALASGAILTVISPPIGLHYLHWFSFLALFWSLQEGQNRRNALLGYASGWLGVFLLFYWLIETVVRFSNLPWIAAFAVLVIFASAFALPYALVFGSVHWFRQRLGTAWVWLTPAVLVSVERLGPALFPYYQGVSQYRTPLTWQLASVTGVLGLSYLVMLTNAALAEGLIYRRREGRPQPWGLYAAVGGLFIANLAFGFWRHGAVEQTLAAAPTLRVAILQQHTTMEERLSHSRRDALDSWLRITEKVMDQSPDLVVWPEGALPYNPDEPKVAELLGGMARSGNFAFLVGGGTSEKAPPESGRRYIHYNSCYLFDRQGKITGRYDKMVPLPFGEYIPFSDTFPFLKDIIEGPGDFRAGTTPTRFATDDYSFTTPICYEAILNRAMWALATGDLFVNITNDAWFGDTASPHQHAMLAAVQATQFGRPMLRIAYTGVCFIVEPHGDIKAETKPFEEVATVESLRLATVPTIYQRGGWIFAWLCVGASVAGFVLGRRRGLSA